MNLIWPVWPDQPWAWTDEKRFPEKGAALMLYDADGDYQGASHNHFADPDTLWWYQKPPFNWMKGHNGIDINGGDRLTGLDKYGDEIPVLAAHDGMVTVSMEKNYSSRTNTMDNFVWIDGPGYQTAYHHLRARYVKVGDVVKQGQPIGALGNNGESSRAHLHFAQKVNGTNIDPWPDIDKSFITGNMKISEHELNQLYRAVFGRPVDEGGLAFVGHDLDFVLGEIMKSPEWRSEREVLNTIDKNFNLKA